MERKPFHGSYVFVAGLHRTGTSLIARLMARSPQIASITGSPAPENEGCYLQGAIPHTAMHGIPGRFAVDPEHHLVEGCRYDSMAVRDRIEADWKPWFAPAGALWRLEKSPVNLTRMRLYQQLFPLAQFVVVVRHPSAMAAALAKWVDTPPSELIDYALGSYERMGEDLNYLHAAMVVRYEDLVARPVPTLNGIFAFLDTPSPPLDDVVGKVRDGNADYPDAKSLSAEQQKRAERWGYRDRIQVEPFAPVVRHQLRAIRENTLMALKGRA